MPDIKAFRLKDIGLSQTGPFGSQLHENDYVSVGTPIVTVEHLQEEAFSTQNLPFVSDKDVKRLSKYVLKEGDIVFSRVGSVDRSTYVSKKEEGWLFSGRCLRVRIDKNKANPKFISFYFRLQKFKNMMQNISVGATMPSLNTHLMDNIKLYLPSLSEQNNIAKVLASIDEKILLNKKLNDELEIAAKDLYNYWFVQFDFPDEFRRPYKSSGGKMVYNEILKREIPEGWEVKSLGDICTLYQPETISEKDCTSNGKYYVYGSNGIIGKYDRKNHDESEIVISCRGDCGNIIRTMPNVWITGNAMVVRPKSNVSQEFIYFALQNAGIKRIITGSVQGQITRKNLEPVKIVIAPLSLLEQYEKQVCDNVNTRIQNNIETELLQNLRDFLLPMLMNGQVSVSD